MMTHSPRKKELAFIASVTLLITLALYYPLFFKNCVAVNLSDATIKYLGYYKYVADNYVAGRVPLWNPFVNLGQSMFSSQCSPFTVLMLPYIFLLPEWANSVSVLFCLWLTMFCSWLFFRIHGLNPLSSCVSCVVYCFAGPVFFLHSYYPFMLAFSVFPLSLVLLRLWLDDRNIRHLVCLAVILALGSLSISLDIFIYMLTGLFFYLCANFKKRQAKARVFLAWVFFMVSLLMVNALHTVPLIEWVSHSTRREMSHGLQFFPDLYNLIFASLSGFFIGEHNYPPYYFYIGISGIVFAAVGLLKGRRGEVFGFFVLSLVFLFFYGVLKLLYVFDIRVLGYVDPLRGFFVFVTGFAYMAGAGFHYLWERRKRTAIALTVLLSILSISLAVAHVSSFCCQFNYLVKTERLTYTLLSYHIGSDAGDGRLSSYTKNKVETSSVCGIRVIPFAEGAYNRRLKETMQDEEELIEGLDELGYHKLRLNNPDAYLLAKYGVKFLIEPVTVEGMVPLELRKGWKRRPDIRLYPGDIRRHLYSVLENENFIGRAYIVSEQDGRIKGDVFLQGLSGEEIICKVYNADAGDRLVLSDLAFPGWKAEVNGKEEDWDIYGGCLRRVKVPEGKSIVKWTYEPLSFKIGLVISLLGAACLAMATFFIKKL